MTFATLMQHPVTIVKPGVKLSRAGDKVFTWEDVPVVWDTDYTAGYTEEYGVVDGGTHGPVRIASKAWVAAKRVFDDEALRDQSSLEVEFFLPPTVDIANEDRIEWDGRTFHVIGPPAKRYTVRGLHHLEVKAVEVDG